MATSAGPYTIEMLDRFPNDGQRYEILDGVLIVTPAPLLAHQTVQMNLAMLLGPYVRGHRLGHVWLGPADVIFDRYTRFEPDVVVAVGDGARRARSWRELPDPALAVEILSPSSARWDRGGKRERYLTRCAEYWIVDIEARLIERWRPGDGRPSVHRDSLDWQPDPRVPALRAETAAVFSDLPEPE